MNEINNFNQFAFKNYATPVQQNNVTNPMTSIPTKIETTQDFYIDSKGAQALKANVVMSNPTDITQPISANDYEAKIQKSGMIKGQDYDIVTHQDNGKSIYIIDKQGNPTKSVIWAGGTSEKHYDGYTNISYPSDKGITSVSTTYDKNNNVESKEVRYKDVENHKNLFPENININTTVEDYTKILKEKNINFEIDKQEENGNKNAFVVESDVDGNMTKMTTFNEFADGSKMIGQSNTPDKNGNLVHDVSLISDGPYSELIVSDYLK